jgi:tetratricopeptide (TPR) repeat protein
VTGWPAPAGPPPVGDPRSAYLRAEALVELGRPDQAVAVLHEALAVHPGRADLWGQLAMALLAAERPAEAYQAATTRIQLAPADEWGFRLASLALSALDRGAEAIKAAAESVRLAPLEWRAHARLAHALADEGRLDEAQPAAYRAVELAPNEPEAHMAVGAVAIGLKSWLVAERAYRQVLGLEPGNAAARNNLALVELHHGGVTGAAAGFADAVATDPRVDVARRNLEVTLRVFASRLLYVQSLVAGALWLCLQYPALAQGASIVAAAATAALAGFTRIRWRALPEAVRGFAVSLLRGGRRYQAQAVCGSIGFALLAGSVGLAAVGSVLSAQVAAAVAAGATVAARLLGVRLARRA